MPKFSKTSQDRLDTCHEDLQRLFERVVEEYDCSILCGHRGQEEQNRAFEKGLSKLEFPKSKHNRTPSLAVDVAPYPVDWKNWPEWYHFAGYVKAIARDMGISVRWGGDWDSDNDFEDQNFNDLPHWEIV